MSKNESLKCPFCEEENLIKKGLKRGRQRYKCNSCGRKTVNPLGLSKLPDEQINDYSSSSNKTEFVQDGNKAELNIKTKQIKTLEDLINESDIDLKVWKIDRHIINKWDGYQKTGDIVNVVPLFQVKIFLSKIIPDKVNIPIVQPIEINSNSIPYKTKKSSTREFKKALIIPDIQAGFKRNMLTGELNPFHDRRCLSIDIQVAKKLQPEKIILLGDNIDFAEISRFTKTPEFYFTIQPTLIELSWFLSQLRNACPNSEIQYLEGNHCSRLWKTISENALFAYGLKSSDDLNGFPVLSVPNLLGLDKLNIQYSDPYPTGQFWINDNLRVSHGQTVKSGSGETVKAVLQNARCSEIFGHIHRLELASKTIHGKNKTVTYSAFSPGCQCKLDGTVPSFSNRENWQNGFGVVEYEDGNGKFQINPYSINDGVTLFNGEIIEGQEELYLQQLKKDTGWNF